MSVLIVGGAGFIGSHLQEALLKEGFGDIIVFDTLDRNSLKYTDLKPLLYSGDVRNRELLEQMIVKHRPEVVFNLASMTGIERVDADPINCMDINFNGTKNVCELALRYGVRKVIHFSSSEVYGECHSVSEEDETRLGAAGDPRWTYSASKIAADHLVSAYASRGGLNACIVRPFNIFGPRQTGHGAISHFIAWSLDGLPIKVYGDGAQVRSWCIVYDLARAVIQVLRRDLRGVINIGDPYTPLTINDLAEMVVSFCGSESEIRHVPKRPVDIMYRVPNIERAQKLLDWRPVWNFEDSLKHTVEWYRSIDYHKEEWRSSFDNN